MSSEGYLGAFEDPTKVVVVLNREMLESTFQTLHFDDSITVTEEQWKQVFDAVYKSDAVSDFIESVIEIAEATLIQE